MSDQNNTYLPKQNDIFLIREMISEAALYEQLAEECVELAHAALKKARKLRNENYTPATLEQIDNNVEEEFTDICLAAEACGIKESHQLLMIKAQRWYDRLRNH